MKELRQLRLNVERKWSGINILDAMSGRLRWNGREWNYELLRFYKEETEEQEYRDNKITYHTGRYTDLREIGHDEAFQKNRRGIIERLNRLEDDMQAHFKVHSKGRSHEDK